ncbi:MAG: hypothetical protein ACRD8A_04360 [Candidatus Acidiferrales bacterium]
MGLNPSLYWRREPGRVALVAEPAGRAWLAEQAEELAEEFLDEGPHRGDDADGGGGFLLARAAPVAQRGG